MTNEEWLEHLAHNDIPGLRAWFKAEHVESPGSEAFVQCAQIDGEGRKRAAEGDTEALEAKIAELEKQMRIGWECECRLQAERDNLAADLMRANNERELYREALSQLLDTVTDGMSKVSAILDNYDEGMA